MQSSMWRKVSSNRGKWSKVLSHRAKQYRHHLNFLLMAEVECTLVQYAVVSYIPVDGGGGEGEFVDVDVGPLLPPPPPQGQRGQVLPTYVRSSMQFFCENPPNPEIIFVPWLSWKIHQLYFFRSPGVQIWRNFCDIFITFSNVVIFEFSFF